MGRKESTWAQYFLGGDRMNNKYKTDPAHVRKQNAQSQQAGATGQFQTEFASESATNAQQVRAQNAASANAKAQNSAAGQYQTEIESESATNAQQVRAQNARSQNKKNKNQF